MELAFHTDWPAAAERLTAFWQGEILDRPPMYLTVAKPPEQQTPVPVPASPEQHYFDPEFLLRRYEAELGNCWFVAEALPCTSGMMAGWLPTYGAPITPDWDTIWIHPIIADWDRAPDWQTAWDDGGWRRLVGIMEFLVERAAGRFFVGMPPMLPPNDLLALLRGTEDFLRDLLDEPDRAKHALAQMTRNLLAMRERLAEIIHTRYEGIHHHYPLWCPEPLVGIQSDISCMLSPAMFEEFIIPELETITSSVGRAIYHLDGPDAIKHLDRILDLPHLSMLQWVPGSGNPQGFEDWLPLFQRAQAKGKAIYLPCGIGQLETAIREFRPELTFLICGEVGSFEEANAVLLNAEKWTARYWGRR
jgi:hypothetical protein